LVEEAYTQQGRAHSRRLRPEHRAARPALTKLSACRGEGSAVGQLLLAVAPQGAFLWPLAVRVLVFLLPAAIW
jgi:hypothetical protein